MARQCLIVALLAVSLYIPAVESAKVVTEPTQLEWAIWPEYCRARFVASAAGRESMLGRDISKATVALWESKLGGWWYALHHHCAGLLLTARARLEPEAKKRTYMLNTALREFRFTLARTPQTSQGYAETSIRAAFALQQLGDVAEALNMIDATLETNPTAAGAYAAKAMILRDKKDFESAIATLKAGNEALDGNSAELHYFLGLTYIDVGDYEAATAHAREAYALGHQLPGLRTKLASAGYSID